MTTVTFSQAFDDIMLSINEQPFETLTDIFFVFSGGGPVGYDGKNP